MKIKTKRIITSLALAASLAIAPMNVSADVSGTLQITQGDVVNGVASRQTTVRVNRGVGLRYVVEVPDILEFDLKTDPSTVDFDGGEKVIPEYSTEELRIYLRKASGFTGTQKLEVFPSFKGSEEYGIQDGDVVIKDGDTELTNQASQALKFEPSHQEQQPFDYYKSVSCSIKGDDANNEAKKRVFNSVNENDPNAAITIGHIQYNIEVK